MEKLATRCARYKAERDCARQDAARMRREVESMRDRLMPEGMEWPRFEDGEPVRIGDVVSGVTVRSVVLREDGIILSDCTSVPGWGTWRSYKEPIKRPAPEVLDADGVEIRKGDTVWHVETGEKFIVETIYDGTTEPDFPEHTVRCNKPGDISAHMFVPDMITHRAPVLAADGKPLREGEHVYHVETGTELVVKELPKPGEYQAVVVFAPPASHLTSFDPDQLTHERPDSWERLRKEMDMAPYYYCRDVLGMGKKELDEKYIKDETDAMRDDLVRRAKALAERGQ